MNSPSLFMKFRFGDSRLTSSFCSGNQLAVVNRHSFFELLFLSQDDAPMAPQRLKSVDSEGLHISDNTTVLLHLIVPRIFSLFLNINAYSRKDSTQFI